ncbi:hypothetical protein BA059_02375 [Mycolicibacterium sp. (ex Dasyatis americana)]|nr:hypothetical protein BA059_02375 [Mycolicibacterium sp. (ex Dasyatis americana)]
MTLPAVTASPTYPYRLEFDIIKAGVVVIQADISLDRFPVNLLDYTPRLDAIQAFLEDVQTAFVAGGAYDAIDVRLMNSQAAPFPYELDSDGKFGVLNQTTIIRGWSDVYDHLGIIPSGS